MVPTDYAVDLDSILFHRTERAQWINLVRFSAVH